MKILMIFLIPMVLMPTLAEAGKKEKKKRRHRLAHVHGEAQISIAVDGKVLEMLFQSPADGVFGFEHEPLNDQQKKVYQEGKKKLEKMALNILSFEKGLTCKAEVKKLDIDLAQVRRTAADERMGRKPTPKGHGDVKGVFEVICDRNLMGTSFRINMYSYFKRIVKTRVAVLGEKVQISKTMEKEAVDIKL